MAILVSEDDDLLVVNKPAGVNTHAPSPFAGEGIFDWLRHREPRWSGLAIMQRLDKETSGVMLFSKSVRANLGLTRQFTGREVRKSYLFLTDRTVPGQRFTAVTSLVRSGEKYLSRPLHAGGERAETRFESAGEMGGYALVRAEPVTGKTHQIRVHAAESGMPVLGDELYGGTPWDRVCLHAEKLRFKHPGTGEPMEFQVAPDFFQERWRALRRAFIDPEQTDSFRWIQGASDGHPGWYLERLGEYLLSQSEPGLTARRKEFLAALARERGLKGVYHRTLTREAGVRARGELSPQWVLGERVQAPFVIRENGVRFGLSFQEGYSVGIFLDQRENRRRFLTGHIGAGFPLYRPESGDAEVLNAFAYTCGFSVCAARGGAKVTSVDLSKKYLEWGKRNFELNGLPPDQHDFIYGDALEWMRRLGRKRRVFDVIILDPPTFSRSKPHGTFRVENDFGKLAAAALPLLKEEGVLLASTNSARLEPERFLEMIRRSITDARRKVLRELYVPQPPDFPVSRGEPAYLKTVWVRVGR